MRFPLVLAPLLLLLALSGCSSDDVEPAPTIEPPPGRTGCEPGTLTLEDGSCKPAGIGSCAPGFEPDGDGGCNAVLPTEPCGPGTMAIPGETLCREIAPCADGTWGDIPTDSNTQHVDRNYTGGSSDGSATRPWLTIQEGISAAAAGATVAVAEGNYPQSLTISGKAVVIQGRCPALVAINTALATAVVIETGAHGSALRDIAISGVFGVAMSGSENVIVDRVWIHDTTDRGLLVENVLGDSSLELSRSLIERATNVGVSAFGAGLSINETVIRDTQPGGGTGRGVSVRAGSVVSIVSSLIERNHDLAVLSSGTELRIEASLVRDTQPIAGAVGGGLAVQPDVMTGDPGHAVIDGAVFERNHSYGVLLNGADAEITRTVLRDTQPQPVDGLVGAGVQVQAHDTLGAPSRLTIDEAVIERNHYAGISATGSVVDMRSLIVRDQLPLASGEYGRGVVIFVDPTNPLPTSAYLAGSRIERSIEAGIAAHGAAVQIEETAVLDTRAREDGDSGRGINVQSDDSGVPSQLTLHRVLVDGGFDANVFVEGSTATIDALEVRNTKAEQATGFYGDAFEVIAYGSGPMASASIVNSIFAHSDRAGVAAFGASLRLADSTIECNLIDLNGQSTAAGSYTFTDDGGNRCGCGDEQRACKASSTELDPPAPLEK